MSASIWCHVTDIADKMADWTEKEHGLLDLSHFTKGIITQLLSRTTWGINDCF